MRSGVQLRLHAIATAGKNKASTHRVRLVRESSFLSQKIMQSVWPHSGVLRLRIKYRGRSVFSPVERMMRRTYFWQDPDGNHRVPNVNANSDGDFKFNLGNFENDWNSDNVVLCLCDIIVSPATVREFCWKAFVSIRRASVRFHQAPQGVLHTVYGRAPFLPTRVAGETSGCRISRWRPTRLIFSRTCPPRNTPGR